MKKTRSHFQETPPNCQGNRSRHIGRELSSGDLGVVVGPRLSLGEHV
jgi:hypothetical protein